VSVVVEPKLKADRWQPADQPVSDAVHVVSVTTRKADLDLSYSLGAFCAFCALGAH
jgi:hypothetical protein